MKESKQQKKYLNFRLVFKARSIRALFLKHFHRFHEYRTSLIAISLLLLAIISLPYSVAYLKNKPEKNFVYETNLIYSYVSLVILLSRKEINLQREITSSVPRIIMSTIHKMWKTIKKLRFCFKRKKNGMKKKNCAVTFEPFFMPIITKLI